MSGRQVALLAILLVAVENSFVAAIVKKGLEEIPPLSFASLRFFIATLCILPIFFHKKGHKFSNMREITPISLLATVNIIFFVLGLKLTTANIGSIIYAAVPLLTGVILYFLFKERLSRNKVIGIIIGFVGVLLITALPLLEKGNPFAGNLLGNLFLTVAIISWSFYMVYSKKLHKKYSPFMVTANFIVVTSILLVPFFIWDTILHYGWWEHLTAWGIFSLIYMGIIVTIIGYMLIQYATKHGGTVFASTTFYVTPVLAFIVNFLLLGEELTPILIVGSVLALAGTFLVMRK